METSMRLAALLLFTSIFAPMATAQRKYSEWKTDTCFQGLHWRVSKGDYNASAKKYTAYIQFRNSYQTRVAFGYIVKSSAEELDAYAKLNGVEGRVSSLDSQSEDADLNTKLLTSDTAMLVFGNVRFLAPGDVDVTTKFERCDAPASRGASRFAQDPS